MNDQQSGQELACWVGQLLDKKGGRDIQILDLRGRSTVSDYLVIATGTSSKHMETLVEAPCLELKRLGFPADHIEGRNTHWVVADFGDVILHIFDQPTRQYYDLEDLWKDAPRIDMQPPKRTTLSAVML